MRATAWLVALMLVANSGMAAENTPLHLRAAGGLRAVMGELAQAFAAADGTKVQATFGASGLVREGIENGDATDVFASADVNRFTPCSSPSIAPTFS